MSLFGQFPGTLPSGTNISRQYPHLSTANAGDIGDQADVNFDGAAVLQLKALSNEFVALKEENESVKNAVFELQKDRDNLRSAVRNLKMENNRVKAKLMRMTEAMKSKRVNAAEDVTMDTNETDKESALDDDIDYDNIGDFLLIGGPSDPLSIQYRAPIRDSNGAEHKTLERYMWYKMAETFNDQDAMNKILIADTFSAAEEVMKSVKNFDHKAWDAVKMRHWENGHRMKFEQYRSLKCLLVKTDKQYLAVACQDKVFGTGWRKQRDEAARPRMWDGENRGGKFLMKLRNEYAAVHVWGSSNEEQEARNLFNDSRLRVWRKARRNEAYSSNTTSIRNTKSAIPSHNQSVFQQQRAPTPLFMGGNEPFPGWTPFRNNPKRSLPMAAFNKRWRF